MRSGWNVEKNFVLKVIVGLIYVVKECRKSNTRIRLKKGGAVYEYVLQQGDPMYTIPFPNSVVLQTGLLFRIRHGRWVRDKVRFNKRKIEGHEKDIISYSLPVGCMHFL